MTVSPAKLSERSLRQHDGAGRSQLFDDERIFVGKVVAEHDGTQSGWHPNRVHLVLEDDGDAVKGSNRPRGMGERVQPVSLLQRSRIDGDDRIDRGPIAIEAFDAVDIELHQFPTRQLSRPVGSWMSRTVASRRMNGFFTASTMQT